MPIPSELNTGKSNPVVCSETAATVRLGLFDPYEVASTIVKDAIWVVPRIFRLKVFRTLGHFFIENKVKIF